MVTLEAGLEGAGGRRDISQVSVLLVEDAKAHYDMAIMFLTKINKIPKDNITLVTSLDEATSKLKEGQYDVLVLDNDFFRKRGDASTIDHLGLELLRRTDLNFPPICIMFSGNSLAAEEAEKLGATYVGKNADALAKCLNKKLAEAGIEVNSPASRL